MRIKQVDEDKYQATFTRDELVSLVNGLAAGQLLARELAGIVERGKKPNKQVAKLSAKLVAALESEEA